MSFVKVLTTNEIRCLKKYGAKNYNDLSKVKVKVSHNRPRWPKGFRVGQGPVFFDVRHYEGGR